jgi:hypothetical protein
MPFRVLENNSSCLAQSGRASFINGDLYPGTHPQNELIAVLQGQARQGALSLTLNKHSPGSLSSHCIWKSHLLQFHKQWPAEGCRWCHTPTQATHAMPLAAFPWCARRGGSLPLCNAYARHSWFLWDRASVMSGYAACLCCPYSVHPGLLPWNTSSLYLRTSLKQVAQNPLVILCRLTSL